MFVWRYRVYNVVVSFYQRNSFVIHSKVFLLLNPVEIFSPILFFYILTYGLFHQWRRKEAQSRTIFVFHVIRGMKLCARGGMGGERVEGEEGRGEGEGWRGEEGRGEGEEGGVNSFPPKRAQYFMIVNSLF